MDRIDQDQSNENNAAVLLSAEDMTDEVLLRAAVSESAVPFSRAPYSANCGIC
jgi:hypothetical protein